MGTIAQKLTYLNGTKQALKESINNIGGSITNETTFREYAQELDNIYTNLPKTTGEGTNLSLTTLKGKMGIIPKGNTQQDGTPTPDIPIDIEVVTGTQDVKIENKNMCECKMVTQEAYGITLTNNNNGTYTISGTNTRGSVVGFRINQSTISGTDNLQDYDNGTYALDIGITNENLRFSIMQMNTWTEFLPTGFGTRLKSGTISNATNTFLLVQVKEGASFTTPVTIKPMLLKGSYTTSTIPEFTPHQEQTQTISLSSKNLIPLNQANFTTTYSEQSVEITNQKIKISGSASGVYSISVGKNGLVIPTSTDRITFKLGSGTYKYTQFSSGSAYSNINVRLKDENTNTMYSTGSTITLTETHTFSINLYVADTNSKNAEITIQLEEGSSATSFEQYYNIELCKIGNYQDYLYKTSGKNLAKEVKIVEGTTAYTGVMYLDIENDLQANTTYTLSFIGKNGYKVYLNENITTAQWITCTGATQSLTFTTNSNIDKTNSGQYSTSVGGWVIFKNQSGNSENGTFTKVMLEKGSTASVYEPYGSDKWYKKEYIGKHINNGTQGTFSKPSTNRFNIDDAINDYLKAANVILYMSNEYKCYKETGDNASFNTLVANENYGLNLSSGNTSVVIRIKDTNYDNVDNYKTFLNSNNLILYYVIANANDIQITNETLIEQLNNLEKLMSYNGTTNISSSGNLAMVLSVSAIKGE